MTVERMGIARDLLVEHGLNGEAERLVVLDADAVELLAKIARIELASLERQLAETRATRARVVWPAGQSVLDLRIKQVRKEILTARRALRAIAPMRLP